MIMTKKCLLKFMTLAVLLVAQHPPDVWLGTAVFLVGITADNNCG